MFVQVDFVKGAYVSGVYVAVRDLNVIGLTDK